MLFPSAEPEALRQLAHALNGRKRIAIVTHYNPDGDAIGSSLGLARVLEYLGHAVKVVLPNTPPPNLHWMPGFTSAVACDTDRSAAEEAVRGSDVLFCLDFNRPDRVQHLEKAVREAPFKVLIDHHRDPDTAFDIIFSDTSASATSQMVFDIIHGLGHGQLIDADVAGCLFAGIMTDSGSFRFSSTTPHTFRVAAELVAQGAVPERIHEAILDDNSEHRLRLLGFALHERLTVHQALGTAVIVLSKEDLDRFGFQPGDTEGLVNYGLGVRGIRLAVFVMERPDVVKLSLRSKGSLPVHEFLAAHFNGGGHMNAAGGHAREPLVKVVERLMAELPAFLAKHPA